MNIEQIDTSTTAGKAGYVIATGESCVELEREVADLLGSGYEPQGGVSFIQRAHSAHERPTYWLLQSMFKRADLAGEGK